MQKASILLAAAGALAFAGAANAALLNLDINGQGTGDPGAPTKASVANGGDPNTNQTGGAGAVGTVNDFWNGVLEDNSSATPGTFTATGLLLADGTTLSTVTVSVGGGYVGGDFLFPDFPRDDLLNDYIVGVHSGSPTATPGTVTISGLLPNTSYDLYMFASNGRDTAGGVFSVNGGATQTASGEDPPPGGAASLYYQAGFDYAPILNVLSNANGELLISEFGEINVGSAQEPVFLSILNGFQLSGDIPAVPEPAGMGLLALSALGALARRRRA